MNDTKSSQMVRDDFSSELEVSGELLRDQGEATPDRPLSPAELASVNAGRVEANFKVTLTLEEDAIKQGAVTADEVYNFALSDDATKSGELKRQFKQVTLELKNPELSKEDRETLRIQQAELLLSYAYTTVGMLHKYYKAMMYRDILTVSRVIRDPGQLSEAQVRSIFDDRIGGMSKLASGLETFHGGVEFLVPELVGEFPQLRDNCDRLNDRFITFLGRDNQLEAKSDQSARELNRFVAELQETISLKRIQKIKENFELQFEAKYGNMPNQAGDQADNWDSTTAQMDSPEGWSPDSTQESGVWSQDQTPATGQFSDPDSTSGESVGFEDADAESEVEKVLQDAR
ncbi:hypothetical protein KC921_04790 [Candidatus Woesebacteria bacterium]|nr:hypothetical protein [Candidatus Woesebacteria bacterium]